MKANVQYFKLRNLQMKTTWEIHVFNNLIFTDELPRRHIWTNSSHVDTLSCGPVLWCRAWGEMWLQKHWLNPVGLTTVASLWCFQHFGVNQTTVKNIISPHISKRKKKKIVDWETKSSLISSVQPSMMKSHTEWPCSCLIFHDKLFLGGAELSMWWSTAPSSVQGPQSSSQQ